MILDHQNNYENSSMMLYCKKCWHFSNKLECLT